MWVLLEPNTALHKAMESFTFATTLLSLKQESFENKGLYKKNVIWLLYLALKFLGSNTLLQSGSHWPLYLNKSVGPKKLCCGVAIGFIVSSIVPAPLLSLLPFSALAM